MVRDAVVSDISQHDTLHDRTQRGERREPLPPAQHLFRRSRHRSEPVAAHSADLRPVRALRLPADAGHPPQAAAIFYPALLSCIRAGA